MATREQKVEAARLKVVELETKAAELQREVVASRVEHQRVLLNALSDGPFAGLRNFLPFNGTIQASGDAKPFLIHQLPAQTREEICEVLNNHILDTEEFEIVPVSSSVIKALGYRQCSFNLRIEMNTGNTYIYYGVPNHIYEGFFDNRQGQSIGEYYNAKIKGIYASERIN